MNEQAAKPVTNTRLRIDVATADRQDIQVSVDRRVKTLPATGVAEFDIKPGEHLLRIRRDGFMTIEEKINIVSGEIAVFRAKWTEDKEGLKRARQFDIPTGDLENLDVKPMPPNDEPSDDEMKKPDN